MPTKVTKKTTVTGAEEKLEIENLPETDPTELVIKEIMIQKNVDRDEAINILKNPSE